MLVYDVLGRIVDPGGIHKTLYCDFVDGVLPWWLSVLAPGASNSIWPAGGTRVGSSSAYVAGVSSYGGIQLSTTATPGSVAQIGLSFGLEARHFHGLAFTVEGLQFKTSDALAGAIDIELGYESGGVGVAVQQLAADDTASFRMQPGAGGAATLTGTYGLRGFGVGEELTGHGHRRRNVTLMHYPWGKGDAALLQNERQLGQRKQDDAYTNHTAGNVFPHFKITGVTGVEHYFQLSGVRLDMWHN